ncbi:lactadherin-like [Ptychodera flava]|uniref:lactadherin-like n=1 Tax=Ptychodera flava TaxID=63121 RepID=UPI00396A2567
MAIILPLCSYILVEYLPDECSLALLETRVSEESSFTASSQTDSNPASDGRLHLPGSAWCADTNDDAPWLQVDLGENRRITGVSTQGGGSSSDAWVTSYALQYSESGNYFNSYTEDGDIKIFDGNTDSVHPVQHTLASSIVARYVRILPRSKQGDTCLRFELFGCDNEPIDYCENNKCQNGAICVNQPFKLTYECNCPTGFIGEFCEEEQESVALSSS